MPRGVDFLADKGIKRFIARRMA